MHRPILAAGGIIWRPTFALNTVEVLLVHRPRYDDWTFPKGKLHKGETLLGAAVREVSEETGLSVVVGHRMPAVSYRTSDGPKEVTYWAMQSTGGEFVPNREVDDLRWESVTRAAKTLSYDHDRRLAEELVDKPPGIVRVVLVRHADAGHRSDFDGPDVARPLVDRGARQADRLVTLVSNFRPTRVWSAPALRCIQTVLPMARARGLNVDKAPMFGEDEFAADRQATADQLLAALASTEDVTVIVSQGGVIPELMTGLSPPGGPELMPEVTAKAGAWALAFGAGRVRADYYPPTKS
ncbi:NUDIX hydrolase [soil metagenome]